MFKILDGRDSFYQWDQNQKLIVEDATIDEVHFCNKTDDEALVCEVYTEDGKRVVNVPNILLQDNWDICVYAFCGYTKYSSRFKVKARSKPADYIYTETEVKSVEKVVNDALAELKDNLVNGFVDCSIYQESEKDDTAIKLSFTDMQQLKGEAVGTYNRTADIGVNATALGTSVAMGNRSLAAGSSNLVKGKSSMAFGTDNFIKSNSAGAIGYANAISGEMGIALGASNFISGKYAAALNGFNNAYGSNALATGNRTSAVGAHTLTGGQNTWAYGSNAVAFGNGTGAEGECSFVTGYKTQSNEFCQMVIGRYNTLDNNALFIVGSGYDDNGTEIKRNAFTVNMDGTATLFKNPIKPMDVATKDYVDKKIEELKALIK